MKRLLCLLLAASLLAGCISININLPPSATPTAAISTPVNPADGVVTDTPTQPAVNSGPTPTPTVYHPEITPTIDLTAVPPRDSAPRTLYFLLKSAIWVLRPNAEKAVRLTAEDTLVTAFDVWARDGRIAYGTKSSKLYVIMPGQDPRLLVKLPDDGPYPAYINGVDWSPDGSQLAYTVDLQGGGQQIQLPYPSSPSGLWTVTLQEGRPIWMLSNRYPSGSPGDDVNQYRRLSAPRWSPDGGALLLAGQYWEWTNQVWLYPLGPSFDDANLHTFQPASSKGLSAWNFATWMPDSQGLLFAGQLNTTLGGLGYAARDGSKAEIWVSGEGSNLYIYSGALVPEDSYVPASSNYLNAGRGRLLYLAGCPVCLESPGPRLFVQLSPLADSSQNGEVLNPPNLCNQKDQFGNLNEPRPIEWQPDFSLGVLACGPNEVYLLNLHRPQPEPIDLLPALPPLDGELPVFRWGPL